MADSEDRHLPSARPGVATAEQGVVILDGPQGAVATLTPEAAAATGDSLQRAAGRAERQRRDAASGKLVPLRPADGRK